MDRARMVVEHRDSMALLALQLPLFPGTLAWCHIDIVTKLT